DHAPLAQLDVLDGDLGRAGWHRGLSAPGEAGNAVHLESRPIRADRLDPGVVLSDADHAGAAPAGGGGVLSEHARPCVVRRGAPDTDAVSTLALDSYVTLSDQSGTADVGAPYEESDATGRADRGPGRRRV